MKNFNPLFILLIGMISLTAMSSTPLPETKQTTAIVKDFHVSTIVGDVLSFSFVDYDVVTIFSGHSTQNYVVRNFEPVKSFATILDVGWQSLDARFEQIRFTEKLNSNYLIDQEKNLQKLGLALSRNSC